MSLLLLFKSHWGDSHDGFHIVHPERNLRRSVRKKIVEQLPPTVSPRRVVREMRSTAITTQELSAHLALPSIQLLSSVVDLRRSLSEILAAEAARRLDLQKEAIEEAAREAALEALRTKERDLLRKLFIAELALSLRRRDEDDELLMLLIH